MFTKICGVTTVEDALLAAGLGADAIGLNFYPPSKRYITVDVARDIVKRLPPEILAVGVFRNELPQRVVEISHVVGLRAAQLHGHETPSDCRWVAERVPALIRAFSIDDPALVSGDDYGPNRLMVDAPEPGAGRPFDWGRLNDRVGDRPFILAGGLTPDNVALAVETVRPWGVDVASGVEESPGRKDPVKVRKFLAAAREAGERFSLGATPPGLAYGDQERDTRAVDPFNESAAGMPSAAEFGDFADKTPVERPDKRRPFDWNQEKR